MKKYYLLTYDFNNLNEAINFFKKEPIQPQKVLIYIKNDGWYYFDDGDRELIPLTLGKFSIDKNSNTISQNVISNKITLKTKLSNQHRNRLIMLNNEGEAILTQREINNNPLKLNLVKNPIIGVLESVKNNIATISSQNIEEILCKDILPQNFNNYSDMFFIPGNDGKLESLNKIINEKPNADNYLLDINYGCGAWIATEINKPINTKSYFKQTTIFI